MGNNFSKKFGQEVDTSKCGCYLRSPEKLGIKFQRAIVPLRHIDYHLQIVNSLVNITLKQTYYNPIQKYIEVDYSLPISPESSIFKFQVQFNNVKIEGTVKDKDVAKQEHQKAKSQGRQVAIATIDPNSKDIFNIQIGNIPPKTQFVVTICLLQQMKVSLNTFYQLQVPAKISPRYMNQVDGVVRFSESMQNERQKSGPADYKWSFKIDVKTTRRTVFFDSPSHSIKLKNQNQSGTQTFLQMQKSQIPHKDFIFVYTTENFHLPSHVLGQTDISTTVMLSFIPKFCDMQVTDAYKSFIQNKPYQTDITTAKGEYIFLLDRSGSMEGSRISQAKKSLVLFLKSLPQDSYFNVTSFGSSYSTIFDKSQKTNGQSISKSIKSVQEMAADLGGTEIYEPLLHLLKCDAIEGYPRHIFLLTDGDVSDTEGVINMVKRYTKYSRVHSIGIGSGASYSLIEGCAKSGKGKSTMISDDQNPAQKIIELLQSTLTPLISKVDLKYETDNEIQSIVPNPKSIPYILKDDIANFYVTFKGHLQKKVKFSFEYEDPLSQLILKADIQIDPKSFNQPFVDKMAHLKVLRLLQSLFKEGDNIQDHMYYVKTHDYKKEAIQYSIKNQLLSQFTAFSCVGKKLVDGKYEQYKDLGVHKIYIQQPSRMLQSQLYYDSPVQRNYMSMDTEQKCCEMEQEQQIQNIPQISMARRHSGCLMQDTIPSLNMQELSKEQKRQKNEQKEQFVDFVVKLQATDGRWSNNELIEKLSKNIMQIRELQKKINPQVMITKLVVKWFQKNHPSKQYNLIVKKALAWLKKKIIEQKISEKELDVIQPI